MKCGAVIPAAGQARRFGEGDKTLRSLGGRPLLEWSVRAIIESQVVSEIVVVVSELNQFPVLDLITSLQAPIPVSTVRGGEQRKDSVAAGVRSLPTGSELILIHDAARPLVSPELIRAAVSTAGKHGAAIPGVPVTDTVKRVAGNVVVHTVDRAELIAVQTPQVFRRAWLLDAYAAFPEDAQATDEASIIEAAGFPVQVIPGEVTNLKVTTPSDALIAEVLLQDAGRSR